LLSGFVEFTTGEIQKSRAKWLNHAICQGLGLERRLVLQQRGKPQGVEKRGPARNEKAMQDCDKVN